MIDKNTKSKILDNIRNKDEKILVSSVLDKAMKFEKTDSLLFTNFLNLNETKIIKRILDYLKIKYFEFYSNENIEKRNIFFIPEYLLYKKDEIIKENISCIKIVPKIEGKLMHKDYMGAIYSLGIKREFIGDIVAKEDCAYFFCMKSVEEYFSLNLTSVGNQEVSIEILDIFSDEVKNLDFKFISKEYIVPSLRVDAILSEVYNLSRSEVKDKIIKEDLYINDKVIVYPNTIISKGDIISFKKCGKIKFIEEIRKTKNSNVVIRVFKYS